VRVSAVVQRANAPDCALGFSARVPMPATGFSLFLTESKVGFGALQVPKSTKKFQSKPKRGTVINSECNQREAAIPQRRTLQLLAASPAPLSAQPLGMPRPRDSSATPRCAHRARCVCVHLIGGVVGFLISCRNPSSVDFQESKGALAAPSAPTSWASPALRPGSVASTGRKLLTLPERVNADN